MTPYDELHGRQASLIFSVRRVGAGVGYKHIAHFTARAHLTRRAMRSLAIDIRRGKDDGRQCSKRSLAHRLFRKIADGKIEMRGVEETSLKVISNAAIFL